MPLPRISWTLLVVLACIGLGARLLDLPPRSPANDPVEPVTSAEENSRHLDPWLYQTPELIINHLAVDHSLSTILFATAGGKAILMDRSAKPLWEKTFSAEPRQARLSGDGSVLAVGTSGGKVYYEEWQTGRAWEQEGFGAVQLLGLSGDGEYIAAWREDRGAGVSFLALYNRAGEPLWELPAGKSQALHLRGRGEALRVICGWAGPGPPGAAVFARDGELLWSAEGLRILAVSARGDRLAAVRGEALLLFNDSGRVLWERSLSFAPVQAIFPEDGEGLLVIGYDREWGHLCYFDRGGELLWTRGVAPFTQAAFIDSGESIAVCTDIPGRKENSEVTLLNREGNLLERWDVAVRIDRLAAAEGSNSLVLWGKEGLISVVDLSGEK